MLLCVAMKRLKVLLTFVDLISLLSRIQQQSLLCLMLRNRILSATLTRCYCCHRCRMF